MELVETAPLISIVGPGGAGKTRAAIEAGMRLLERFPDGVWFVELAPVGDASLVAHAIAGALRVRSHRRGRCAKRWSRISLRSNYCLSSIAASTSF